jgi:hypothetical protein
MDPKKDILAELDLPGLFDKRSDTVKKQKEAAAKLDGGRALHLTLFWLGGAAMALAATWVATATPDDDSPAGMFLLSACIIFWLGMWVAACFPGLTVRHLQDKSNALSKQVKDLDIKIEFCHQVLEEAKKVKVRKYAETWAEKQMS